MRDMQTIPYSKIKITGGFWGARRKVGREHTLMEYLSGRDYTSRKHAEIVVSGNRLVIRDLGKPNGTFINNVRMAANSMETLKDGDRVSLGGLWEEDWKNSRTGCFAVSYPAGS